MQGDQKMKEIFSRLDPNKATQKEIENFMQGLLKNYVLEVAGEKFAFAEIEIYTSADKNTYKRVSSAGDIFFITSALISVLRARKRPTAAYSCARFGRSGKPSR